jgi:hypothetical protein
VSPATGRDKGDKQFWTYVTGGLCFIALLSLTAAIVIMVVWYLTAKRKG